KEEGIVWVLEACDLNVFGIRRALWQLREAGWFANAKGFLIGRPLCYCQEMMGLDHYHAVLDILGELGVPIVMDADIGHLPPHMPLLMGSYASVTADEKISITMRL
ncbi:MAG: LD-carboxypeptidase, partial [Lachnospiraceae bacterium]|nr:LD-carboxypeptidase [Lachnospiraceae bacterium]